MKFGEVRNTHIFICVFLPYGDESMKLFAGAGCGTIHFPDALFPMEGFCGIHDEPVARVLAMECGEKAALVSLELVMLPPEFVDMVKSIVEEKTGAKKENIWVHTTHAITTPHAPHAPIGMGGVALEISEEVKKDLETKLALYTDAVMTAVSEAAKGAAQTFQPAMLGLDQAVSHVCVNRDMQTPFGWWIGRDSNGKVNPNFDLLRFDGEDGKPIAVVVIGGLKPTTIDNSQMREGKRLVSSDVPGLVCRMTEMKIGAPVLYFMGAAGDQVPKEQALLEEVLPDGTVKIHDYGVEEGLKMVDRLGNQMAKDILPVIQSIVCGITKADIAVGETAVTWGGKGRIPMMPRKTVDFAYERDMKIDGNVMILGDIALVGLKPEVNCITAEQLAEKSPYQKTILISMINGGQKYMPDAAAYENITWEAQSSMMMPGAAEAWIQAVVNKLREMKN